MGNQQVRRNTVYKEIEGFPNYRIGSDGEVYSFYIPGGQGRLGEKLNKLAKVVDGTGYYIVSLIGEGGKCKKSVHRIFAEAFIPNPECKEHVNHIDGVKTNNSMENLEWNTPKENATHASRIGLTKDRDESQYVRVAQISKVTGEILKVYESFSIAQKETGIWYTNMLKVCKGTRKHAGGFIWQYA